MSEIGELYDTIMAGEMNKVAGDVGQDGGVEFDGNFWEKVASGDEEANTELGAFIDDARENGYDDEQIAAALDDAMYEGAAIGDEPINELEEAKHAAWNDGFEQAIAESLELAKQAGIEVDVSELADYDRGTSYGDGFAQGRLYADEAIEKIAEVKEAGMRTQLVKALGRQVGGDVARSGRFVGRQAARAGKAVGRGAKGYGHAMAGGRGARGWRERVLGARGQMGKVWGARVGTAAGLGGGAALVASRRKK
jgi:hypothetical protein